MRDLRDMSAREVGGIASGDFSSAEVIEHFVGRLRAVNGKLNAVTADLSGSARKGAADVDKARARREASAACRPAGHDQGMLRSRRRRLDVRPASRRNEIESRDDPYIAALWAAGAIPIAKTNVPQLMLYAETDNPLYGRTNNPWDLERSCGLRGADGAARATELMPMPGAYGLIANVSGFPAGVVPVTRVPPGECDPSVSRQWRAKASEVARVCRSRYK